jgi:photosystem II stability/assembly factor-like uncharacterized protein
MFAFYPANVPSYLVCLNITTMKHSLLLLVLFWCVGSMVPALAQKKANILSTEPLAVPEMNPALFKGLKWRNIGPYRGGRAVAVSGVPNTSLVYFAGYTGGGLWKTEDAGLSWFPVADEALQTGSVGDIAVAPTDPNVIYVGMGEHAPRGVMTFSGDGIYKSTDGGKSWKHLGLEKTQHISDVVVHPKDADIAWVAAQGALHGPSADRGIYKTRDGGKSWKKVLFVDEQTGASSLSVDVNNPRILYAATWQHRRLPWKVESGGPGCGIWKSVDEGETWTKINAGLPAEMGKIGVSVSPANPERVYAIVEAEKSKAGLYRSDNGGKSWQHLSADPTITSRSWYYMEILADPRQADVVYVLNSPLTKSIDGGKTFTVIPVGHIDTHDLWINPNDTQNMILGDDGGAEITFNGGRTWSSQHNQATAQFYRVNVDKQFPYHVYGGQQDNSSIIIASRNNGRGITDKDWREGPGCESAWVAFDNPEDPQVLFGGCYQGYIDALDTRTGESKDIMAYPSLNLAVPPKDMKYRFNWNAPIVASVHEPGTIYHAGNVVLRSRDKGMRWEVISPDLTRNEPDKQGAGGGPLTNEGAGAENYHTIYYLAESPIEPGVLYTGSDCGLVYVSRDYGKSWQQITPAGLPECSIHAIEVSPHDKGTLYITGTRFKFNDFGSYTYKSTDYGKRWTRIATGIRESDFLKVIREDPVTKGLLYGGAERGFYVSFNGGMQWHHLPLNLPAVPITDLMVRDNDLVAATAGRAFWILDDLSPLQQSAGKLSGLKLYAPKPTVLLSSYQAPWQPDFIPGVGKNPDNGVILTYFLPEQADSSVLSLEIFNPSGQLIRSYSNKKDDAYKAYPGGPRPKQVLPATRGLHRFAWDFRTEGLPDIPGVFVYGNYGGYRVGPGQYKARLSYRGEVSEVDIRLVQDPRLGAGPEDWAGQQVLLELVGKHIADMHGSVNALRVVRKQVEQLRETMAADQQELIPAADQLLQQIKDWESGIVETRQGNFQDVINWPSKLNAEFFDLRSKLDVHDPRVTQGVRDRLNDLEAEWAQRKAAYVQLVEQGVAGFNKLYMDRKLPVLKIPAIEK